MEFKLEPVIVIQNKSNTIRLINEIISQSTELTFNQELYAGNSQISAKNIIIKTLNLNYLSFNEKKNLMDSSLNKDSLFLLNIGPQTNLSYDINFNDFLNIKPYLNGDNIVN